MGHLTKRKLQARETKQKLLETGLKLFLQKGFDNVTVDEIVKKCNLSKGAFYLHFSSKYDIFNEKFKDVDNFYAEFVKTVPKNIPAVKKIQMFYEAQMIYIRDELGKDLIRTVYMNAMSLTINKNHYLANPDRNLYKVVNSFVVEGVRNNEFRVDITEQEASRLITRCMRGTLYDWVIFGDDFNLNDEMDRFIGIILEGLSIR